MAENQVIEVHLFGTKIGRLGFDDQRNISSFEYDTDFLSTNKWKNIFPVKGVINRVPQVQLYKKHHGETFRSLPPPFADSLPDNFGSMIFKTWLEQNGIEEISIVEQLAYIGNRGVGAVAYIPSKELPSHSSINLDEIISVLKQVMESKTRVIQDELNTKGLLNIFKMGSSPGGARAKLLIAEHKDTGEIIPGDIVHSKDYYHYLIKLAIDEDNSYPREIIEYCYYASQKKIGIKMMDSKLIDGKHFATQRFDRQNGNKQHVLTACGITGWDFKNPEVSSYENLFKLSSYLKIPQAQMVELFKRMVFNVIYENTDDHLKNHSYIYNQDENKWYLSPAYDITYAQNPLLRITRTSRALSINGKRGRVGKSDLLKIADDYTIKNPNGIINEVYEIKSFLLEQMQKHKIADRIIGLIDKRITFPT